MSEAPNALVGTRPASLTRGPFAHQSYMVKQSYWSMLGRVTRIYAPDGLMVAYVKRPVFRWREELGIYADEEQTRPILQVRARKAVAVNLVRDVFDAATGELVGSIRQRGLRSILRDTWDLLDAQEQVVGLMQEDGSSLMRRFFPLLTGKWHIELAGEPVAYIRQVFRLFSKEFHLDLSPNRDRLDPRFAFACSILALMAESRRERS